MDTMDADTATLCNAPQKDNSLCLSLSFLSLFELMRLIPFLFIIPKSKFRRAKNRNETSDHGDRKENEDVKIITYTTMGWLMSRRMGRMDKRMGEWVGGWARISISKAFFWRVQYTYLLTTHYPYVCMYVCTCTK